MKNVAIVGLGKWGKLVLQEFSKISNVKICVSLGNLNNKKWLKSNFPSIEYSNNYEQVLDDSSIDAIIIVTPINTHYELALKALKSKKHVFVEKPIAQKVSEANELLKYASRNNLCFFVGNIFLYHEIFKKISILIKSDELCFANFEWKKFGTFKEDLLLNLVVHDLSLALSLFGTPKKININNYFGKFTKLDLVSIDLFFSKKRKCKIDINRISNEKKKSITFITKNNLYIWSDLNLYKLNNKTKLFNLIFTSTKSPLSIECKEFLNNIKTKNINKKSKQSLVVLKILDKYLKSYK
tara:strand:- start:1534 stop:2424 length:891 start_codon:yes stop_codon:yes gene_type:complete